MCVCAWTQENNRAISLNVRLQRHTGHPYVAYTDFRFYVSIFTLSPCTAVCVRARSQNNLYLSCSAPPTRARKYPESIIAFQSYAPFAARIRYTFHRAHRAHIFNFSLHFPASSFLVDQIICARCSGFLSAAFSVHNALELFQFSRKRFRFYLWMCVVAGAAHSPGWRDTFCTA